MVLSELTVIGRGLGSLNVGEVMAKMFFDPKHFARKWNICTFILGGVLTEESQRIKWPLVALM